MNRTTRQVYYFEDLEVGMEASFAKTVSEADIAWYVASGEGHDKAGGYAIQGLASRFIPRIEGSYSNVDGLPIAAVDDLIRRLTRSRSLLASDE